MTINQLQQAFSKVKHPGNRGLLGSRRRVNRRSLDDNEVKFLYAYQHESWQSLSADELSRNWECIFFLSDRGFMFLVPKFIEMIIIKHDWVDEWIDSFVENN